METYLVGCNQASEVLVAVAQAHLALAWEDERVAEMVECCQVRCQCHGLCLFWEVSHRACCQVGNLGIDLGCRTFAAAVPW